MKDRLLSDSTFQSEPAKTCQMLTSSLLRVFLCLQGWFPWFKGSFSSPWQPEGKGSKHIPRSYPK